MKSFLKNTNLFKIIFKEKCPNCGNGDVFQKGKNAFKIPVMHERCSNCNFKYEKEPGFFIGAMYVSYGLAIFQGIIAYISCQIIVSNPSIGLLLSFIILTIVLLSKLNFKWSRIIYIYLFKGT